jgi:hypothetical protein
MSLVPKWLFDLSWCRGELSVSNSASTSLEKHAMAGREVESGACNVSKIGIS